MRVILALFLLLLGATAGVTQNQSCFGPEARDALAACDLELANRDQLTRSEIAAFERARAGHLIALERYAQALDVLATLDTYDGASETHHFRRALALLGLEQIAGGLAALNKALELNPQHVDSLLVRAEVKLGQNQLDAAVADAGLAVTLSPENPKANTLMAKALEAMGAAQAAARMAEAAADAVATPVELALPDPQEQPATDQVVVTTRNNGPPQSSSAELIFWDDVKSSESPEELELFISTFPNSVFAPLAQLRLRQLGKTTQTPSPAPAQVVAMAPPSTALELSGDGPGNHATYAILETPSGGIFVGGSTETAEDQNRPKPWVAMFAHDGTLKWQRTLNIVQQEGYIPNATRLTNGTTVVTQVSFDSWEDPNWAQLIAFDDNGTELWRQDIGEISRHLSFISIRKLLDGGFVTTTSSAAPEEEDANSIIARYEASGQLIWKRELDLPGMDAATSAVESDKTIFVTGFANDTAGKIGTAWVRKFDLAGQVLWQRTLRRTERAAGMDIIALANGDAIALGTYNENGNGRIWLDRLTADGTTVWRTEIALGTRTDAFRMSATFDNEIILAGNGSTDDFEDGSVAWITWLDENGKILAQQVEGGRRREHFYGVSATHDGGVLVAGDFTIAESFDTTYWVKRVPPRSQIPAQQLTPEASEVLKSCITASAHPGDKDRPFDTPGFTFDELDPDAADKSCALATALFPKNKHALYHKARVEHKQENFEAALALYKAASDQGHVRAMVGAGLMYSDGPEAIRNDFTAASLFEKAIDTAQDGVAAELLADAYADGKGVNRDSLRAVDLYHIAALSGSARAEYRLGYFYANGIGVTLDSMTARSWFEKAADQGHTEAYYALADQLQWGIGGPEDRALAHETYMKASDAGSGRASYFIAGEYRFGGDIVNADVKEAARWYQKAIDQGFTPAYGDLGFMYQYSVGLDRDMRKALELYKKGVEAGDGNSHYRLGKMYEFGDLVSLDKAEAVRLFEISANTGNNQGKVALAYMLRNGVGTAVDEKRSYALFRSAAESFSAEGRREAGWMLYVARGVEKDVSRAIKDIEEANSPIDGQASIYLGYIFEHEASVRDPDRAAQDYFEGLEAGDGWPMRREASAWHRPTAQALQRLLRDAGHYNGSIDGSMGSGSRAAMKTLCDCE